MIVLVTLTIGLVFWVTGWAFGFKAFDGFLIAAILTVIAAGVRIASPHMHRLMRGGTPAPGER